MRHRRSTKRTDWSDAVLQASLLLVNIWQIPAAVAQNYATVAVARVLGGFSSAGGSVTLGMVADFCATRSGRVQLAHGSQTPLKITATVSRSSSSGKRLATTCPQR